MKRPWSINLALGWLLFVALWMSWSVATYSAPFRWLADWQLAANGEYDAFMTFVVPTLLLATPAIILLRLRLRNKPAVAVPANPEAAERFALRFLGAIGLGGAVLCVGILLWAQRYPDRSGPFVEVNLATLGDAAPPLGPVTLIGSIDADHVVKKTVDAKGVGGRNLFAAMFTPDRPARIFVKEYVDSSVDRPLPTGAGNRFKGVLVEGGLPADTAREFARLHVEIANPYYLLLTGPSGAREGYYVAAGLSGFVALMGLLPLGAIVLMKRVRRVRPERG